ncbi:MAG: hypothetical protein V6Z86_07825 [Hyphomicrobiales bacterium]
MSVHEFVGLGLYSTTEVARLLRLRSRNINRWVNGYRYKRNDEVRHIEPLLPPDIPKVESDDQTVLSFRDLIELRFVGAFLGIGIDLRTIRDCLNYARDCIGVDHPFSSAQFRTDGKTIFLMSVEKLGEPRLLDLKRKQYAFKRSIETSFRDLDIDGDSVVRWRPYHGKKSIVIDPARSFGQPIASASGVPTVALVEAVKAEGSVPKVAAMYNVERSAVRDAVKFHGELIAA